MSAFIVACPGCGTQFRVTEAHLAPASGLVRCGACLAVFRAEEERIATERTERGRAKDDGDRNRLHATRHRPVLAREVDEAGPARLREDLQAKESTLAQLPDDDARAPPRLEEITLPAESGRLEAALAEQRRAHARRRRVGPPLAASVVLVLLAAAQLVWLRFDELAEDPTTRPLLADACELLGCALPVRRDAEAIRSQRLVVRSHPERDDGLRVDAVIVNRAAWPQAFPEVELRFSDIDGRLVAARRFTPREYLAGELAGRREMPVAAPVQISLELLDPGPDAVNYEMRLY